MGVLLNREAMAWLEAGSIVLTASERTARAWSAAYDRNRQERGEKAWAAPRIEPWPQFLRACWLKLANDPRMILSQLQEQSLWATVAAQESKLATTLEPSRARLGKLAMDAHLLLANYAPTALDARARASWQGDQETFSRWLEEFNRQCRSSLLISSARLPLELALLFEKTPAAQRPPLLLIGFDRLQPSQRHLLEAWGEWRELTPSTETAKIGFYAASDRKTELEACALWCREQLEKDPESRLLVVTQNQDADRGEIERAFLEAAGSTFKFEFSLGIALSKTALARSARLLLHWLTEELEENALDWLFASGYAVMNTQEQTLLQRRMRRLRARGRQRPSWSIESFLSEPTRASVSPEWQQRLFAARSLLQEANSMAQTPLAWAEFVPRLLEAAGWPGGRALSSAEFQARRRLFETLDTCASLGFAAHAMQWKEFLALFEYVLNETLYTPQSTNAPVLIAGPAETAGLTADGIWFLGATEDGWPAAGSAHPFLPLSLQRECSMPHAHSSVDWALASVMTERLAHSTPKLCFSYARQLNDVEAQPSRLILKIAGEASPLPAELQTPAHPAPRTELYEDRSQIPYPAGGAPGGSDLIANQSCCPFRAFASARLNAQGWDASVAGLSAAQRGTLLHAVLHSVWSGPPQGIHTSADLAALTDLSGFVRAHVERVFAKNLPSGAEERMPRRYLALERRRLAALVEEWLTFEGQRIPFTVGETELKAEPTIEGLKLQLRLDRIDRLADETLLVVDYKSGDVKTKSWAVPRPEDPQLPLYAAYGLEGRGDLGGLVFAKVRAGEMEMAGHIGDAQTTLLPGLSKASKFVKQPFTAEMLLDWRDEIERLARAFVAGEAEADPREYPQSCEYCDLSALCRIREFPPTTEEEDEEETDA